MYKELWDGIINCRKRRDKRNADEIPAYCACCPLGSECGEIDNLETTKIDSQEILEGLEKAMHVPLVRDKKRR